MVKSYVLDTNTLLTSPYSLLSFDENNVSITDVTLEDLDNASKQGGERASNAREAIRILDELRSFGDLAEGVKLPTGGLFRIEINHVSAQLPASWNKNDPCNRILRVCKGLRDSGQSVVLVSTDINTRIKADLLRIPAEEYKTEQVDIPSRQYRGRKNVLCDKGSIDAFFKDRKLNPEKTHEEGKEGEPVDFTINEFVLLKDKNNPSHTGIGRFDGKNIVPLVFKDEHPFGITPRNVGQIFAMEALLMPTDKCSLCILKGPAGTAKTFLSLAVGLHKILEAKKQEYARILVARPNIKFDEDIGFLKGDEKQKIDPLIRPIYDNIEQLTRTDSGGKSTETSYADYLFSNGTITAQAMAYMRGRSISNTWMILDEAQNMTATQAFGIISRAGIGTKVILCGDPAQIDSDRIDSRTNGLSYAAERMKGDPLTWQVTLTDEECVRSELALSAIKRMSPKGYLKLR